MNTVHIPDRLQLIQLMPRYCPKRFNPLWNDTASWMSYLYNENPTPGKTVFILNQGLGLNMLTLATPKQQEQRNAFGEKNSVAIGFNSLSAWMANAVNLPYPKELLMASLYSVMCVNRALTRAIASHYIVILPQGCSLASLSFVALYWIITI